MKSCKVNLTLSNGTTGAKSTMFPTYVQAGIGIQVPAAKLTQVVAFSGLRKSDEIRFVPASNATADTLPFLVTGSVSDNDQPRVLTLRDSEGAAITTVSIPSGGGAFTFAEAPADSAITLD